MKIVVLGGYGNMGSIISRDLAETFRNGKIVIAGRDKSKAVAFARSFKKKNVSGAFADLSKPSSMKAVLKGVAVLVNASNYQSNLLAMKAALASKVNYIDLGGLYHMTKKQLKLNERFKKKDLIGILGCGSSPGITNIMARYGAEQLDRVDTIQIQFADRDYTNWGKQFVLPYTLQTLVDEFSLKPPVLKNGKIMFVKPLGGRETVEFPQPVGKVGCFYAIHSEIATLPTSFADKGIRNCSFREGFPQEFVDTIKRLVETKLTEGLSATPKKGTKVDDVEYLRVELNGSSNGKRKTVVVYCKAVTNKKWNIPAGSWNTGVPPSIIAQMIANGDIEEVGVYAPESDAINPKAFFKELEKRNMEIITEIRSVA